MIHTFVMILAAFGALYSGAAMAQGSVCYNYDTEEAAPADRLTDLVIRCKHEGNRFYLDGSIDENLIYELTVNAPQPITTIYLNSRGGKVSEAKKAAAYIREQGISTVVQKGAVCRSACTLLFQAGVERWAAPEATFLYHSVRDPFLGKQKRHALEACWKNPEDKCLAVINKRYEELLEETKELFSLYITYGAKAELKEAYFKLEEVPEWWHDGNYLRIADWEIGVNQALELNVVTHLLEE